MLDIVTLLTGVTALIGGFWLARALVGPIRGRPAPVATRARVRQALGGASMMAIAVFVAAPVGYFGAWFFTLGLGALVALARPDWMLRGRAPTRAGAVITYLGLMAAVAALGALTEGLALGGGTTPDAWLVDVAALASLLGARGWLWFWRKNAPFADPADPAEPRAAADTADRAAWWDRVWMRREAGGASGGATTAETPGHEDRNDGPAVGADGAPRVPGYDPVLLAEELSAFRDNTRAIDRVALTWPDHPVTEALIHVSVILNETRQYLQEHPDKYRDLRPILVGHASTAADIARLVQRIKGTGETLDDAEGVARRLFALASLMRETRRMSTQAERDRLNASMAVIDEDLNAVSAMRDIRARVMRP